MTRLRSNAIAIALLFGVAFFLNSAGDYAAAATSHEPNPKQAVAPQAPATDCTLRFDGLYELAQDGPPRSDGRTYNKYLRFWKEGTAESMDARSADVAGENVGFNRLTYRLNGCEFEVEHKVFTLTYAGTVVGNDSIQITSTGGFWRSGTYKFIPVDFEASARRAEQRRQAQDAELNAQLRKALGDVTVSVGRMIVSEGGKDPAFVASPSPIVFPPGTTAFAYRVSGGASATATLRSSICPARRTHSRTSTQYAIVAGSAVPRLHTVVFSCDGEKPFLPGTYTLSVAGTSIQFTIRR